MQAAAMQIIYKGVFQWFLKLIVGVQFTDCRFLKKEKQFIILANHNSHLDTAQETFPCLVRAYFRKNLMPSEKFAPDKLHDVIDFRKELKIWGTVFPVMEEYSTG